MLGQIIKDRLFNQGACQQLPQLEQQKLPC
jgi:hypothetical protein